MTLSSNVYCCCAYFEDDDRAIIILQTGYDPCKFSIMKLRKKNVEIPMLKKRERNLNIPLSDAISSPRRRVFYRQLKDGI